MKTILHKVIVAVVSLMVTASCDSVKALPAPGTYEKRRKEATEVLQLRVVKIQKKGQDEEAEYFICDAKVVAVEKSVAGNKKGDIIQFETFYLSLKVVGPARPPRLRVGWYGRVYLNPPGYGDRTHLDTDTEILSLAADGESFEKLRQRRRRGLFRRR